MENLSERKRVLRGLLDKNRTSVIGTICVYDVVLFL